jgi:hypothetical protein
MPRRIPTRLTRADATRLFFAVDECTADELASADAGRPSDVVGLHFAGSGRPDAAWHAYGTIDDTYGRLEASLVSDTGPWTTISDGGSLADATAEGVAGVLRVRFVSHRWGTLVSPDAVFTLGQYSEGAGALDED